MQHRFTPAGLALAGALLALLLSGCQTASGSAPTVIPRAAASEADGGWRAVATLADRDRLRGWWDSFRTALTAVRAGGQGAIVDADPALYGPQSALPNAHVPPGDYQCRTIKLGSRIAGAPALIAYPAFRCRVTAEQNIFGFAKLTGSQRPIGLLFDDTDRRQIFLGTLVLGDEGRPMDYGADRARDMVAIVERIGASRWRMIFPAPAYESTLDIIELSPVS